MTHKMPMIAVFYGIMIRLYRRAHAPRHLNPIYQGFKASIAIENGEVIGGHPPNALKIVQQWVLLRQSELMENWRRGRRREPFEQVAVPEQ